MKIPHSVKVCLFIVFTFFGSHIHSQIGIEPCASEHIHEDLNNSNPQYQRSFMYLMQKIEQYRHGDIERSDEVFTLPVVVHIIHEGEVIGTGSNISDEQILSAIDGLNEDFRKVSGSNGDGDGVDIEIDFCLASRDPDGNSTTGIIRVDGSSVPNYAEMGIQANDNVGADESAVKALSTWPREDYINIWIVNEIEDNDASSGVQGYAYFPVDLPEDGIVVLHNAFGTVGNLKPNTDENRTITHEMGHFFALYHTFHSTNSCGGESNCETQGDEVCDTPQTTVNISCTNPACDGTQQVENYMDYTSETCKNMFTEGQKERMRATLETERSTLINSLGCIPVSNLDAGITHIKNPSGTICSNSYQAEVYLTNFGSQILTEVTIEYGVDGILNNSFDWSGSLESGSSMYVTLPIASASSGTHDFQVSTENPNGSSDENSNNDFLEREFTISSGDPLLLEVSIDFFGSETSWEILDDDGNTITSGGPYIDNSQGLIMSENICAASGCYDFIIYDQWGDGMSFTNGSYSLFDTDGSTLVSGGGNFGDFEITNFCFEQTISEGEAPVASFTQSDNTVCENSNIDFVDGSFESPTNWSWTFEGGSPSNSSNQNPQNIYYDSPGTYDVTLTVSNDYGSDTYTSQVEISSLPQVSLTAENPSCFGSNDGQINSNINSTDSYSVNWSNGSNSENLAAVSSGTYTITITTSQMCSAQASTTLSNPDEMILSLSGTHVSCHGLSDGFIQSNVNNAQGNLDYSWSNNQNSENLENIGAGNYTLTVSDQNNCTASESMSITEPSELNINLTHIDIGCSSEFGSATVNPSGGNGNYQVNWSNGSSGNNIENLNPGNYSVSVSDQEGCTSNQSFSISSSVNLVITLEGTDPSCHNLSDGSIISQVNGGSGNLEYSWNTGATSTNLNSISSGTYTLEVEDSEGCQGSQSIVINNPNELTVGILSTDISCYGLNDGYANASINGGTGTIELMWSNGSTSHTLNNLSAGNYSLIATDENACQAEGEIEIIDAEEINLSVEMLSAETCSGFDGSAMAIASGGSGNLVYNWSNGFNTQTIENVSSGIYNVVVNDGNGCIEEESVLIEFECDQEIPTTQLIETDCGRSELLIADYIECDMVEGAEMYQWKFSNGDGDIQTEVYTIGNNNSCQLYAVENIHYETSVNVSLRVLYDGIWSEFGTTCQIYMADETPSTQVANSYCESYSYDLGSALYADASLGASTYEWKFVSETEEIYLSNHLPLIFMNEESGLNMNTEYMVSIRCQVGPYWSEFGSECPIFLNNNVGVETINFEDETLSFYPNPSDGDKIYVESGNFHLTNDVIELELFTLTGKLIETFELSGFTYSTNKTEVSFDTPLSPGIYVVRYNLGAETKEQKLIVR